MKLYICIYILLSLSYIILGQSNIGKFLHVTDIHYDPRYKEGSPANCYIVDSGLGCCNGDLLPKKPYRSANKWGDYNCDTSFLLMNESFNWIKKNIPDIDFIIYTGDAVNHHDITQSVDFNLKSIKTVHDLLYQYFPKIRTFPNIGNHDTYPIDQTTPFIDKIFRNHFVSDWKYWLNNSELETVSKGGYYWTRLPNNMNLISINTLYYDTNNLFTKHNPSKDWMDQWKWLNDSLTQIKQKNESVWILSHIPPYSGEASKFYSDKINNITYYFRDIIKYQFYGHSHADRFLLHKKNNTIFSVATIPSSLLPSHQDPSFRIYFYNKTNYDLTDYYQYTANLTKVSLDNNLDYENSYQFNKLYNFTDGPKLDNWIKLYNRLQSDNKTLMNYYRFTNPNANNKQCDTNCKNGLLNDILPGTI